MSFDAHSNFGYSTVASGPSPATLATSLVVADPSVFPAAPFNCTVWPPGVNPLSSNAEIVRVTAVNANIFTIVRAQEGTTAQSIQDGWQIANTTSVKVFTDIENSIILSVSAGGNSAGAPAISFADAHGVSFGMAGNTITASIVTAAGGVAISAGANSQGTGTVVFSNSNNVSFGMNGAGIVTGSASNVQSTQPVAASASNGSFAFSTLAFSNANNVTFGTSAGSIITASINPGAQSTQPVAASASNGSFLFSTLGFSNGNGVTFGTSAGSIISASVAAGVAAGTISAGANSVVLGQVVFSNSNNITFGLNGSTVTASASGFTQSTQPVAASASNGSFAFSTLAFSNANNVTFGTSAGSIITASVAAAPGASINFSAGTQSSNLASVVFSNTNGISFGLSNGTITASTASASGIGTASWYQNEGVFTVAPVAELVSTKIGGFFQLPYNVSFSFLRSVATFGVNQAGNLTSTPASLNASAEIYSTFHAGIFSQGTGASSQSIVQLTAASAAWTIQNSISVLANGSQYTITQAITGCTEGNVYNISRSYALSNAVYSFSSGGFLTAFSGPRYLDLFFTGSLASGPYWIIGGYASSSSANDARVSNASSCAASVLSIYYQNHNQNLLGGVIGDTNTTAGVGLDGWQVTATNMSFSTIYNLQSGVVQNAGGLRPLFQLIRKA